MVHQATRVNTENRIGPIRAVTQGASSVVADALDLAELQTELLKVDAANCMRQAKPSVTGLVVALALLLSALPVLGSGLAELLSWSLEWPLWVCQLLVGGVFLAVGCLIAWMSVKKLKTALSAFSTSQREGAANITWIKQTILRTFSGTA
ncbi:MAG: phage holin family protein [Aureliella sp.]